MPNLTSYHPPPLHLYREHPKTYCDLIEHEFNYLQFLRSRITNKKSCINSIPPDPCHLSNVYQNNIGKCRQINICHFRLRQKHWKEQIENENKRFIQSLL